MGAIFRVNGALRGEWTADVYAAGTVNWLELGEGLSCQRVLLEQEIGCDNEYKSKKNDFMI